MTAADHGEGVGARKVGSAGELADSLLAGIDEVGVDFVFEGIWTYAKHAVLRLEDDFDARWNVAGDERGHADAEVDVVTVAEFAGHSPHNALTFVDLGKA